MIEIDCRKCVNADLEADCCKLYGNNPDTPFGNVPLTNL